MAHVRRVVGDAKAERLKAALADHFPPPVPGWGALHLPPNERPWSHLASVVDRPG